MGVSVVRRVLPFGGALGEDDLDLRLQVSWPFGLKSQRRGFDSQVHLQRAGLASDVSPQ